MLQCQDTLAEAFPAVCAAWQERACLCVGLQIKLPVCRCQSNCPSHAQGFWCATTSSSVTSACSSATTALTSVCVLESFQFLQSRSCVLQGLGDRQSPLGVSSNDENYMLSLAEKAACQRFATQRRGQCIWPCCSCCCSRWPQADVAGATLKGTWLIVGALRSRLSTAISENWGLSMNFLFRTWPFQGCLSNFKILCFF